jgi:hypothetical protein
MEEKIYDVTGVLLSPGKPEECLGNGTHVDENGEPIECCCDECDYLMLCTEQDEPEGKKA